MKRNYELPRDQSGPGSAVAVALCLLLYAVFQPCAFAEFYVWIEEGGTKHISSVPRRALDTKRQIRPAYDPRSIVYQHREMREALHRQAELIATQQTIEIASQNASKISDGPAPSTRTPREGLMDLDELIALEKRGGRYVQPSEDQGRAVREK